MKNKKKYLIIFLFSCALFLNSCGKLQSLVDTAEAALENQVDEIESNVQDLTPPSLPTNFTATLTDETITLSWTNPVDLEFAGIAIRYSIQKYPESIIEGDSLYSGTETSFSYEYTQNTTYYFSLFAKDLNSNWTTIPVKFTITTPSLDLGNIDALEEALASANQTIQQAQQTNDSNLDALEETLASANQTIQNTNDDSIFPDQALENAIRTALNKPSGDIDTIELSTITSLEIYEDISNLEGIEYCTNLQILIIYHEDYIDLSDISALQNLTNLEELTIMLAHITDIGPLENLTKLKKLTLDGNQISNLAPLENLTQLNYLALGENQISDLAALQNSTNLEELTLYANNITDLTPLNNLTNLTYLSLPENQISDLTPLENLTSLEQLNLYQNNITDLAPLENLTHLEKLNLYYNNITNITPLTNLPLHFLGLSFNKIDLNNETSQGRANKASFDQLFITTNGNSYIDNQTP